MATAAPKKMSMMQLTVVVAVNMMGSGIIMLPTNMAKVGAISLLSWIVTALGSMAIAYGFAQAGIFNQRKGGMSAYAEDAYGKSGFFVVFLLYFFSLAISTALCAAMDPVTPNTTLRLAWAFGPWTLDPGLSTSGFFINQVAQRGIASCARLRPRPATAEGPRGPCH